MAKTEYIEINKYIKHNHLSVEFKGLTLHNKREGCIKEIINFKISDEISLVLAYVFSKLKNGFQNICQKVPSQAIKY